MFESSQIEGETDETLTELHGDSVEGVKGETDETPFELKGDSVEDFEGLMRLLYPP